MRLSRCFEDDFVSLSRWSCCFLSDAVNLLLHPQARNTSEGLHVGWLRIVPGGTFCSRLEFLKDLVKKPRQLQLHSYWPRYLVFSWKILSCYWVRNLFHFLQDWDSCPGCESVGRYSNFCWCARRCLWAGTKRCSRCVTAGTVFTLFKLLWLTKHSLISLLNREEILAVSFSTITKLPSSLTVLLTTQGLAT